MNKTTNYRPIVLLNIANKILVSVINDILKKIVDRRVGNYKSVSDHLVFEDNWKKPTEITTNVCAISKKHMTVLTEAN